MAVPWRPDGPARRVGWDIGGAHVKACVVEGRRIVDVAQWPCPLWRGLEHLDAAIAVARGRWPSAWDPSTRHVATMTGEMVDLFADREDGVVRLAAHLAEALGPTLRLYGAGAGFCAPHDGARRWREIASANWRATSEVLAPRLRDALLVDIGSTTTDLIALRDARVAALGANDAERLATGELVYHGVVRTPLCALAPRVVFEGRVVNVMNEFFATTADVYRLTGELDPSHDQHASADGGPKDIDATCRRLARMVGRDAREHAPAQWRALAESWREAQLVDIETQVLRVIAASGLRRDAPVVGAGCGAFLARELARRLGRHYIGFADAVCETPPADAARSRWINVCAPAVAVALLSADRD
jgi:probable H4MPT-linked C1 transfer pathway protein